MLRPYLRKSLVEAIIYNFASPFVIFYLDCDVNVHKRCKNNVAANCGVNSIMIAKMLEEMGMTPNTDKLDQLVLKVYSLKLFC